jgi:hypothetical protein
VWDVASSGHDPPADAAREGEAAGGEQAGTRGAAREPLMYEGEDGGTFDLEKIIIFRRGKHIVVYRSLDELFGMIRRTYENATNDEFQIEIITTAVEQRVER